MTVEELRDLFDGDSDDYLAFDGIPPQRRLSHRPDLHAFLLLDSLVPGIHDMVNSSEHDEIFLDVEPKDLAPVITREQVEDLRRCGVHYNRETESLAMYA
jgi:hypothetical protein